MTEPSRTVFLSYASQDAEAAHKICEALRAAGIQVFLDQSELRGGDAWDRQIRERIHDCRLFIALISAHTEARDEGYFRREWKLAVDRTHDMLDKRAFLLPVAIDATPERGAAVPDKFHEVQWTRLPGGETPPAFVERIQRLLSPEASPARAAGTPLAPGSTVQSSSASGRPAWRSNAAFWAIGAVLAVGVGYFAADKFWLSKPTVAATASAASASTTAPEKSIAVLPFTDLSEKHDQEYFSDGLAEELIDALTKVPNLRVPARTSSFSFKGKAATVGEIARALGVTHVLEGSVRKSGERLRITAQLVRADNGFHLWSETYDRNARDIFAVQDDIARAVSTQLRTTLLGTGATAPQESTSPEAYTLYLQARHLAANDTLRDLNQAVALYHQALELDPNYAPAWVGLAFCHSRRVSQGVATAAAVHAEVIAAANRAIALNPAIPEAYVALARTYMQYERNWSAAAEALAKAEALDPSNVEALELRGHLSAVTGRPSEAVDYFQRAVRSDPLNLLYHKYLGRALHYARRPVDSVTELGRAISLNPSFPGLHYELGRALLTSGDAVRASAAFEAEPEADSGWRGLGLPLGYHATGDPRAQAALADLVAHSSGSEFQVAEAYAFFGDADRAFEWLDKAITLHDPGVVWSRHDALLASIVSDPRFAAYLKRLAMPPARDD